VITRALGKTGMTVSALGFGTGPLGDSSLDDVAAERLVRTAIDLGINVIDTAPSYGSSEARIGRVLSTMTSSARDRVIVVTKGGYGVAGIPDWTAAVISRGIDQALVRLSVDRIDVFLLHSCPVERLRRGDLLEPLARAKLSGKVRAIGYSGDADALRWAIRNGPFDVVECSVNLVDQEALPVLAETTLGVLSKRSLAAAPWVNASSDYADRWRVAFGEQRGAPDAMDWDDVAIRFAAYAPHVSTALLGTRRIESLQRATEAVERGPLSADILTIIHERFATHGAAWRGVV
jgi:aryl-alcohol dehydrogenase-like predicted oxidoreductase